MESTYGLRRQQQQQQQKQKQNDDATPTFYSCASNNNNNNNNKNFIEFEQHRFQPNNKFWSKYGILFLRAIKVAFSAFSAFSNSFRKIRTGVERDVQCNIICLFIILKCRIYK
jgi:hypothetical protein